MNTYDAIIIPGRGTTSENTLPESSISTIEKGVELYNKNQAPFIIFSGKYTWKLNAAPPPSTEAQLMAKYAKSLGLPQDAILLEENSQTTVANLCYVKEQFFLPKRWKKGLIIGIFPHTNRIKLNAEYVFGPEYEIDTLATDFVFSSEIQEKVVQEEESKLRDAEKWLSQFTKGDHKTIFKAAQEYIHLPITQLN